MSILGRRVSSALFIFILFRLTERRCKGESGFSLTVDVDEEWFVVVRGIVFLKHISGMYKHILIEFLLVSMATP